MAFSTPRNCPPQCFHPSPRGHLTPLIDFVSVSDLAFLQVVTAVPHCRKPARHSRGSLLMSLRIHIPISEPVHMLLVWKPPGCACRIGFRRVLSERLLLEADQSTRKIPESRIVSRSSFGSVQKMTLKRCYKQARVLQRLGSIDQPVAYTRLSPRCREHEASKIGHILLLDSNTTLQ